MGATTKKTARGSDDLWPERPASTRVPRATSRKPGRPLLPKDSIRDVSVRVRLTRGELAGLEALAAEKGEPVAALAHGLVVRGLLAPVQSRKPSTVPTTLADVRRALQDGLAPRPSRTSRAERARAETMRERGRKEKRRGRHEYSGIRVYPDEEIADAAFAYLRAHGFPFVQMPVHVQKQAINRLAMKDGQSLLQSTQAARVADIYHPDRMRARVNNATKAGSLSPFDAFHDDELLREAIRLHQRYGQTVGTDYPAKLSVLSGVREVTTWRPGFAAYVYRRYGRRGGVVLDPCMGYGSGLVGWLASGLGGAYVGVDPCRATYAGNLALADALAPGGSVFLLREPFEDVKHRDLAGRLDLFFGSPPYFSKQTYSIEPTQAAARYPTFEVWRTGFLGPLLHGAHAMLKRDGACVLNIADVKIGKKVYPLEAATIERANSAGFVLSERLRYTFGVHFGEAGQPWARLESAARASEPRDPTAVRSEAVLIFRKS